jgi:hypothetical protein
VTKSAVPGSGGDARGTEGGVTLVPMSATPDRSSQMGDQYGLRSVSVDSQQWLDQAPKVVDALKRAVRSRSSPGAAGSCRVRSATGSRPVCCWTFVSQETVPAGTSFCRGPVSSRWRCGRYSRGPSSSCRARGGLSSLPRRSRRRRVATGVAGLITARGGGFL